MRLPDGPKNPPFLQRLQWIVRPLETLDARSQKYGDPFRVRSNKLTSILYFSSPQALQTIFTADPEQLNSAEGNKLLKPLLGEHSLILLDGKSHQRQRQLLMPPFHGERMRAYGQLIGAITEQVISQWLPGKPFAVRPAMQEISLRVILSAVFGLLSGPRFEQLRKLTNFSTLKLPSVDRLPTPTAKTSSLCSWKLATKLVSR